MKSKKIDNRGGARMNAGRKKEAEEETAVLGLRLPVSKIAAARERYGKQLHSMGTAWITKILAAPKKPKKKDAAK